MAPNANVKAETKQLSAAIGAARKKTVNFALLISKNGLVFESDPRKTADSLRAAAKKKGGAKGAWGTMRCEGSKLLLTCNTTPPGNLEKLAKKHFSERGQSLKIEFHQQAMEQAQEESDSDALEADGTDELDDEKELSGADFGELLQKARKKPHNFVWLIGESDLVLKAHPRHGTDKLRQQAKADGGGTRGASGVLTINGKNIILTCDEEPPKSFARLAKTWLANAGHKYLVKVMTPEGEEWDNDESPDGEETISEPGQVDDALSKSQLSSDLKRLAVEFKTRAKGMPADVAKELKAALKSAAMMIAKGDLTGAKSAMVELEQSIGAATDESGGPSNDWKAELIKAFADVKPQLVALLEVVVPANKAALQELSKAFGAEIKAGGADQARAMLDALKSKMDEIVKMRAEGLQRRGVDLAAAKARMEAVQQRLDRLEAENPRN